MILLAHFLLFLPAGELSPEEEMQQKFARVRRVYVDVLTGGEQAAQFRDLIISSLQQSKVFVLTENQDKADAILKGAADHKVYSETHDTSDGITMHANVSGSKSYHSRYEGSSNSEARGVSVGEHENARIEERKNEAFAAMRLVAADGDVVWSSTQESVGGKFTSAPNDVANRVARQLADDYRKAKLRTPAKP